MEGGKEREEEREWKNMSEREIGKRWCVCVCACVSVCVCVCV